MTSTMYNRVALVTNRPSEGARTLRDGLRDLGINAFIRKHDSDKRLKDTTFVINWGCTHFEAEHVNLNHPNGVRYAADKKKTMECLYLVDDHAVSIPEYWTSKEAVLNDIADEDVSVNWPIFCRTKLSGHSGAGIVVAETPEDLVEAKLFTEYAPGLEYRVHVGPTGCMDVQQKRWREGVERKDGYRHVKSYDNGWVFTREDIRQIPAAMALDCFYSVMALGLDFGAVDVRYSPKQGKWWVLEVNSAPGMTGKTIETYCLMVMEAMELANKEEKRHE